MLHRRHVLAIGSAALAARSARADATPTIADGCDCHVHIIGSPERYPMLRERAYTPPQSTVTEFQSLHRRLGLTRTVLIQPSFYGTDNRAMLDALALLGPTARGIAVLPTDVTDADLKALDARGVRGIRINVESTGGHDPHEIREHLQAFARRLEPLGWHIQVYAALPVLARLAGDFADLSVPVVIDHFGMPDVTKGTDDPEFQTLLALVRAKRAYVKLSAPYRISRAAGYADVAPFARALVAAGSDRMVWASDWPHTDRAPNARPTEVSPFRVVDDLAVLRRLDDWVPDPAARRAILVETPRRLYRF